MDAPTKQLPYADGVERLTQALLQPQARVLLYGPPGAGKSYLAAELARRLQEKQQPCTCLSADPGSTAFGLPAAINLGDWHPDGWRLARFEPLCSLNAARFRLPLVEAVGRLLSRAPQSPLIIDAPGLTRGIAAAELLPSLVNTSGATLLVVIESTGDSALLQHELASLSLPILRITSSEQAQLPTRPARARWRTQLWEQYLADSPESALTVDKQVLLGTPPPLECPEKWQGLLIGLRHETGQQTMGEVIKLDGRQLTVRSPHLKGPVSQLLVRDARHLPGQSVTTVELQRAASVSTKPVSAPSLAHPQDVRQLEHNPQVHRGGIIAELVNGLYKDPLLLIKTNWSRRCLLFDLGHTTRLPLRYAHSISDVFISHAHIDHIGGFLGLLRTRLSVPTPCRLYGPPGLAQHIAGMLSGILWDRIEDHGPRFEVAELHGSRLKRFRLQAGYSEIETLPERVVIDGVIYEDNRFQVRTVELDHGTPVMAYAYEPHSAVTVSTEKLNQLKVRPGRWLEDLKSAYLSGDLGCEIELPDGTHQPADKLAQQLLHRKPGEKLVYATDLADTKENRDKLIALAQGAHTLVCEASFTQADHQRAADHGHLTTTACGEIAAAAGVQQLMPFHFSRRYEQQPEMLYREIEAVFSNIVK